MRYGSIVFPHNEDLDDRGCLIVSEYVDGVVKCLYFEYFHDLKEFLKIFLKTRLKFENYRFYYHDDRDYSRFFRNRIAAKVDLDPHPFFRRLKRYDLSAITELLRGGRLKYVKDGDIMKTLHLWDVGKKQKDDIVLRCLGILCYGLLRRVGSE
jgi:hypothetical protein